MDGGSGCVDHPDVDYLFEKPTPESLQRMRREWHERTTRQWHAKTFPVPESLNQKLLNILRDGEIHSSVELQKTLQISRDSLSYQAAKLRKKGYRVGSSRGPNAAYYLISEES